MEKLIRCYRYAIVPSSVQRKGLLRGRATSSIKPTPHSHVVSPRNRPESKAKAGGRGTNPMSNFDNQPDPSRTEVQKGNAQAEVMRKLIQSKFPRTYRLLNGVRFQVPARRQADYPNYEYAAYWDGQLLMDGLTASRLNLLGDPTRWKPIAGAFLVTNEWLKLDQRTLFVERELGEVLKRTYLPEGFCPQDLRWRWNALRLVLPVGLFEGQGQVFEGDVPAAAWDIPSITFLKINKGQCFDYHPDLSKEAQAAFFIKTEGGINRILPSEDSNEDGMGFYFYRRLSQDQKWSVPLYSACRLNDQTLRTLAEAPAQYPADDPYAWDRRADTYLTEVKRFLFNVLLFIGSLPEEYEPDQVLRVAREKKGQLRPSCGPPASWARRLTGRHPVRQERSTNPPGGSYRAIGEPAIGAGKPSGKGACSES
jgi:hypothetical protein